jgi:glycosyltransferase involved in cell wall biosynthesis
VEKVCQDLSEELAARGHEIHVLTSTRNHAGQPDMHLPPLETINRVQVHRFRSWISYGHHGYFPGIKKPLSEIPFDIIHSHCYRQPQGDIALRIARRKEIPALLHVHGGFDADTTIKRLAYGIYDLLARRGIVNHFDRFIVLNERDRRNLQGLNIDPDRIVTIANAAERNSFRDYPTEGFRKRYRLEGKRIVLFVGILVRCKRPDLLVACLPEVLRHHPDAFIVFVGPDAGELATIRQTGERLGVSEQYRWTGILRGDEKHEAYAACELLALPSDADAFGLVLLEAMAHGKPVVTTTGVGSSGLIMDHDAGIITAPGDLQALTDGIIRLLDDRKLHQRMGANASRLAATEFSIERMADRVESAYRAELERRARADATPDTSVSIPKKALSQRAVRRARRRKARA